MHSRWRAQSRVHNSSYCICVFIPPTTTHRNIYSSPINTIIISISIISTCTRECRPSIRSASVSTSTRSSSSANWAPAKHRSSSAMCTSSSAKTIGRPLALILRSRCSTGTRTPSFGCNCGTLRVGFFKIHNDAC